MTISLPYDLGMKTQHRERGSAPRDHDERRSPRGAPVRRLRAALVLLTGLAFLLGGATPASAASSPEISRWDQRITLNADGSMHVTWTIDYDAAGQEKHGPVLELTTRGAVEDGKTRRYPITNVQVASSTQAPTTTEITDTDDGIEIRIGDPDVTFTGRHNYTIDYDQAAVTDALDDHDEFYWNVLPTGWRLPIREATITVSAPTDPVEATCYHGGTGSRDACEGTDVDGGRAAFTQTETGSGDGVTVVVAYPAGTFDGSGPILTSWSVGTDDLMGIALFGSLIGALGAAFTGAIAWHRAARAQRYAGTAPGEIPGPYDAVKIVDVPADEKTSSTASRSVPPQGVPPALVGYLETGRSGRSSIPAAIVDLATRGYLRVDTLDGDWGLTRLANTAPPLEYERMLLAWVFRSHPHVRVSSLGPAPLRILTELNREGERQGWFRPTSEMTPRSLRRVAWVVIGVALGILSIPLWITLGDLLGIPPGTGWIAEVSARYPALACAYAASVALLVTGLLLLIRHRVPRRTALGTALHEQQAGFRRFVQSGNASALHDRDPEGREVFTMYLPYAIAFDLVETWVGTAERSARLATEEYHPTWLVFGSPSGGTRAMAFGTSIIGMDALLRTKVDPPTSSGSGDSSTSGGGDVGGGGGGGGGGDW